MYAYIYIIMYPYVTYVASSIIGSAGLFQGASRQSHPTAVVSMWRLAVATPVGSVNSVKYGTWNWSESLHHG